MSGEALPVGLAGAGPWAHMVHAPVLTAGPETELAGVWSRTPEKAAQLAATHGVPAFERYEELLDACEAVSVCVAPHAQPALAVAAARAGKAMLLEKPLGADVAGARAVADAVGAAGVGSLLLLSYRYSEAVRAFIATAQATEGMFGGRGCFLSNALAGGPFAYGWRLEEGPLLDVGPHIIDLMDMALGRVVDARAHGNRHGWVGVALEHESGAHSQVSICCTAAIEGSRTEVEVFGPSGPLFLDARKGMGTDAFATLRREFAAVARSREPHPCDVRRGVHLQEVLARAAAGLP